MEGSSYVQHGSGCFVLSLHSLNILNNLGNKWYSIKITFNVTTGQVPSKCDNSVYYNCPQYVTTVEQQSTRDSERGELVFIALIIEGLLLHNQVKCEGKYGYQAGGK